MALPDRLRGANLGEEEILELLPNDRASQVRPRFAKKEATDEASDLVAALDFQDLVRVERSRTPALSELTDEQIDTMKGFRNSGMHSVLEPAGDHGHRLEELLDQTTLIAGLLGALDGGA